MLLVFEKKRNLFLYVIIWILYAFVHTVSMYCIVDVAVGFLVVDAVISAVLFAGIGILLGYILLYGKYDLLLPFQRFINYTALSVLVILCWVGLGYLLDYLLLQDVAVLFIPTLFIRGMIGLLMYLIFILSFSQIKKQHLEQPKEVYMEQEEPSATKEIVDRVTVKTGQKLHIIPVQDIIYIQSDGDYVQIVTQEGNYLKEQTMKFFEMHLPQKMFVRVHRSYIVNVEYIARIESYSKQNQQLTLKNGQWLKASLSGYRLLKEALKL